MAFESRISLVQAQKNGEEIWELILTNWGHHGPGGCLSLDPPIPRGACADPYALVYPAVVGDQPLSTVTGLAIAPLSEVDRCLVSYNINPLTGPEVASYNTGAIGLSDQILSVDRPLLYQLNGPLVIRALENQWWTNTYLPDGSVTPAAFGTDLVDAVFTPPTLRLLLFLRGPTQFTLRRAPLLFRSFLNPGGAPGPIASTLTKVINVYGRRVINLMLRGATTGGGSAAVVRIGGVNGRPQIAFPDLTSCLEETLVAPVTLTAGQAHPVTLTDPGVDFLTVYIQRTGVGADNGIQIGVDARDS